MKPRSFRLRLSLWNVAVLATVLAGFALAFTYETRVAMMRTLDRELQARARQAGSDGFPLPRPVARAIGLPDWPAPPRQGPPPVDGNPPNGQNPPAPAPRPPDPEEGPGPGGEYQPGQGWRPEDGRPGGPGPQPGFQPQGGFRPNGDPGPQGGFQPNGPYPGDGRLLENGPAFTQDADAETQRAIVLGRPLFLDLRGQSLGVLPRTAWAPDLAAESARGEEGFATVKSGGRPIRVLSVPWYRGGRQIGVIQVARDLTDFERLWQGQMWALGALLPVALLVAGAGGLFLTERALRPVRQVTQAADRIGAEDLSHRLPVEGDDELADLAATFNRMIARLDEAFQQQRRFTADAAHELRTPLARIKITTSSALDGDYDLEECRDALRVADRAADGMGRLVQQLLQLAREDAGQVRERSERVEVAALLQQAAEATSGHSPASIRVDPIPAGLAVRGDPEALLRMLTNLLENAVRHTPPEGSITLSAKGDGVQVALRVRDTGEGIPPEHLPHVCERFYRVDSARSRKSGGSGLGLAICKGIVERAGGTLAIDSLPGEGTLVTVRLPAG